MVYVLKIGFLIISYFIGAIPFGWLFGKAKGIDLREHGSKNIGTTNAGRVLGRKYAIYTYILDTFKGGILVFLFRFGIISAEYCFLSPLVYGLAAALGHTFPIYLHFRGGKAVATASGMILAFCPWLYALGLAIFLLTTKLSKYVSLGSLVGVTFILISSVVLYFIGTDPLLGLPFDLSFPIIVFVIAVIIFIRHLANIRRIINNKENKVNWL